MHYPYSLNRLKPFVKYARKNKNLKSSEKWSKECLSLPIHSKMKLNDANQVANELNKFFLKK